MRMKAKTAATRFLCRGGRGMESFIVGHTRVGVKPRALLQSLFLQQFKFVSVATLHVHSQSNRQPYGQEIPDKCIDLFSSVSSSKSSSSCGRNMTSSCRTGGRSAAESGDGRVRFAVLSFELAKRLRKPPRKIAEEIVAEIAADQGFEKLEVAGAGYINARLKRGEARAPAGEGGRRYAAMRGKAGKILVEHTSINPNKAAHIGHLRNAILGRYLRAAAAGGGAHGGCAELHRQHRSAGGRRGGGFRASAEEVEGARLRRSSRADPQDSTTTAGTSMPAFRSGTTKRQGEHARFAWIRCMRSSRAATNSLRSRN